MDVAVMPDLETALPASLVEFVIGPPRNIENILVIRLLCRVGLVQGQAESGLPGVLDER